MSTPTNNAPTMVASFAPYQTTPQTAFYYAPQQAMPVPQAMYVTEPNPSSPTTSTTGAVMSPTIMMQPMQVVTPTPFGAQMAYTYSASPPTPTTTNPVFIYNPQVMSPPTQQQMEFTVEETSTWIHELAVMRGWNNEAEVYKNAFLRHQICGNKMKALKVQDLAHLGIKEEHRQELVQAISQAFEEQNQMYNQQAYMNMAAMSQPMQPVAMQSMQPMCAPGSMSPCGSVVKGELMSTIQGRTQLKARDSFPSGLDQQANPSSLDFHRKSMCKSESETMSMVSDTESRAMTDCEMQISDEDELGQCGSFEQAVEGMRRRRSVPQPSAHVVTPPGFELSFPQAAECHSSVTSRSPSPMPGRSGSGFGRTRVENAPMSYASVLGGGRKMSVDTTSSGASDAATGEPVVPKKKKKLMPRPKNPMPYHVLMTLKMKTGRSLQSTYIGHVMKDTVVWVNTVRGRRARIVEKTETGTKNLGWVSLRLEDGKPLLVQEQEYLANPSLYPIRDSETGPIDSA